MGDNLTLKLGQRFLQTTFFFVFFLTSALCFGQADPNDPASPNYRGKKSVYQKKYFATVAASMGRGFDEFSESFGAYSFSGSYALGKSSITLNMDYTHPLDGDTDDSNPWRFDDVELVWNAPAFEPLNIGGRKVNLVPRVTYRAPISGTSQSAHSYGTVIGTLIGVMNVGRYAFILSPRINLSYHEFDTADEVGNIKNAPVAASLVGAIRVSVIKNLFFTASAFAHNGWAYDGSPVPVNGVSSNLFYQATPKVGLTAFIGWRDRVYSNNSLFDDETSNMGLGLITNF
jgi:hypothetical protein